MGWLQHCMTFWVPFPQGCWNFLFLILKFKGGGGGWRVTSPTSRGVADSFGYLVWRLSNMRKWKEKSVPNMEVILITDNASRTTCMKTLWKVYGYDWSFYFLKYLWSFEYHIIETIMNWIWWKIYPNEISIPTKLLPITMYMYHWKNRY